MESEEIPIQCPKGCGQSFKISEMHRHLNECKGAPNWVWNPQNNTISSDNQKQLSQTPQQTNTLTKQSPISITQDQPPIELPKERIIKTETIKPSFCKTCGSTIIESDSFRVCPKCKWIKVKKRYIGFFILRYSMMIFWLGAGVGFILFAWGYHTYGSGIIP